ncbi:glutaredoxin family protein [Solidesulfovibrio sp.]
MPCIRSLAVRTFPLALIALLLAAAPLAAAGPVVELYVTNWCPYCTKAKAYFDGKGIAYTMYDIDKDPAANLRFKRYGGRGVPLVMINGTAVAGYSVAEFEKALAAPQPAPSHPRIATPQ